MKVNELRKLLKTSDYREDAYSFEGSFTNETYVLCKETNYWSVFYSERGQRLNEKKFQNEDDACECLLNTLKNDPTTRINNRYKR